VITPARQKLKRVLVTYEPSREGDAALSYALDIARAAGATLTVASVAPQERTDVGCAHCRASARVWNEQLRLLAHERLSKAAKTIGDAPPVHYLAACGPERQVLTQAARQHEADIVVVPWRRAERLRRVVRQSLAEDLRRRGPWEVVIAPRTASSPPPTPKPRDATARAATVATGDDTEHHRFPASA
jgi:nucleotide-binding universal stress UspA family protein